MRKYIGTGNLENKFNITKAETYDDVSPNAIALQRLVIWMKDQELNSWKLRRCNGLFNTLLNAP